MNEFHFLRPEWFWGFCVFLLLPFFVHKKNGRGGLWQKLCDSMLLRFQLVSGTGQHLIWPFFLITATWTLALVSLAGPAWEKLPQPAVQKGADTVYMLDISMLMTPTDVKPSRLERARFKIHDFLQKTKDGQNALVLYAQDPFVAVPLTTDKHIIDNLLPTVRAGMTGGGVPDAGAALKQAAELLTQAKSSGGRIIVLGSHLDEDVLPEALQVAEKIKSAGHIVSFLGVGTEQGAPVQLPDGTFLSRQGKPVLSVLSEKNMKKVARAGGGTYEKVALGEQDVDALLDALPQTGGKPPLSGGEETKADTWKDFGAILCILILPFAALGYRKGWLGALLLSLLFPSSLQAWTLSDLWTRPDRKEAMAISAGENPSDPALFKDPAWRGAAAYKAGDYPAAVSALNGANDAEMLYNQGNALAQEGRYQQAIEAYKKVLDKYPEHADAAFNKKYLEDRLKNNQQNQQQTPNDKDQNQNQRQDRRRQDQDQSGQQQDSEQNGQDSQQDQKEREDQSGHREQSSQQQQERERQQQQGRQQQQAMQQQESDKRPQSEQKAPPEQKTKEEREKQEQMQWLSVIEDDPSGLLRERIRRHNSAKRRGR